MELREFLGERYGEYHGIIKEAAVQVAQDPADPEHLHVLRTYTRRLQTLIKSFGDCFEPEWAREANGFFKEIIDVSGEARDLDVFLSQNYERLLPPKLLERYGPFGEQVRRRRESRYRALARKFGSKRFAEALEAFGRCVFADAACGEAKERIEQALEALDKKPPAKSLHKLRIRYKRRRYLTELLGYFEDVSKRLRKLKKITDHLGRYHDLLVHEELIFEMVGARAPRESLLPAGKIAGDLEQKRLRRQKKLLRRFKDELAKDAKE